MARSIIPHGNRPRVPAGFGRQSSAVQHGHGPARAESALSAGDGGISNSNTNGTNKPSYNHRSTSTHLSGASPSRNNTLALNASQHLSLKSSGGVAPRRGSAQSLAPLKHQQPSTTGTSDIVTARSPFQAMSLSGFPPYPPSGRGKPATGQSSLLGQSYKPPSKEKFATIPAVTVARSDQGKIGPQGAGTGSALAQSKFAGPAADSSPANFNGNSLLGQSYKAPSTEKFAKLPAVKVVRPEPVDEKLLVQKPAIEKLFTQQSVIEKPVIEKPVIEKPVIQKPVIEKPVIQKPLIEKPVIQKPVIEKPVIEKPVIQKPVIQKPAIEKPSIQKPVIQTDMEMSAFQKPKLDLHVNVAKPGLHDYAVKSALKDYAVQPVAKLDSKENSASSSQKSDDRDPPQRRTEQKAVNFVTQEDIERFTDDTGRRVCLASIPPGTSQSDIRDMLVRMTNAKISSENVAVYHFPGEPRPNYALVEAESEKEAGRIASWVDRERLFGWPISARVVRNMTQEQVNTVLRGETLDSAGPAGPAAEANTPSWTTMTPQPLGVPCRHWAQGYCRDGTSCIYSHSGEPGTSANFYHYNNGSGLRPATSRQSLRSIHSLTPERFVDGDDLLGTRNYRGWPKQAR